MRAIHASPPNCYIAFEQFWGRAVRRTSQDSMSLGRFRFAGKSVPHGLEELLLPAQITERPDIGQGKIEPELVLIAH